MGSTEVRADKTAAARLSVIAAIGVISSFISTVASFNGIEHAGKSAALVGADNELGYPSSAFALCLFGVMLAMGLAQLAGTHLARGWWTVLATVFIVGTLFEIWAAYLASTWFILAQAVLFAAATAVTIARMPRGRPNTGLGMFLIVASLIGFFAAFRLTVDKVGTYIDPTKAPSCNVSVLVQCGKNLASAQGSVFGFPNPLLGIGGWIAVLMVGILLLSGAKFARWFWIAFNVGVLGAIVLVIWLIDQSIFSLGTLCPWCMTTWSVTIPTFLLVTSYNAREGHIPLPAAARRLAGGIYTWVPLLSLLCYVVVFLIAQLQLDVIHRF